MHTQLVPAQFTTTLALFMVGHKIFFLSVSFPSYSVWEKSPWFGLLKHLDVFTQICLISQCQCFWKVPHKISMTSLIFLKVAELGMNKQDQRRSMKNSRSTIEGQRFWFSRYFSVFFLKMICFSEQYLLQTCFDNFDFCLFLKICQIFDL